MKIEDGYNQRLISSELIIMQYLSTMSNEEAKEFGKIYEIRTKYNDKRFKVFKDEYGVKDSELESAFDSLSVEELKELNGLRESLGKEKVAWDI